MKRVIGKFLLGTILLAGSYIQASAQEYTGITGMMHVPTAEMAPVGTARVGAFFLNGEFTPDKMVVGGEKYPTFNHVLAIAPFSWPALLCEASSPEGRKILAGFGYRGTGSG